jgi:LysM repeat protein
VRRPSLIAAEASVPVAQLYSLNGAGAATALFPGDALCLPAGASVVTTVATVAPVVTAAKPAAPAVTHHHTPVPVTTAYTSKPSS